MSSQPSTSLPRDKVVSHGADRGHVKIRCSECLKVINPLPGLTADHQDYVYHFCSPKCLDKWRSRR